VRAERDATPKRRAISWFAAPSAANNNARACATARDDDETERVILSSSSRCSFVIRNGGAPRVLVMVPT
jgi:hypothetical protein